MNHNKTNMAVPRPGPIHRPELSPEEEMARFAKLLKQDFDRGYGDCVRGINFSPLNDEPDLVKAYAAGYRLAETEQEKAAA